MKHLLTVILVLAVLAAAVAGCGGAHRYDARLTAADSLMQAAPDSALALIEAVCRDSLAGEGDRAYRDLLLTQSRYRNYITATSDSDINRALAWYRAHSGEREKLTRALIYKGAVMEELGHPDSAMLYYKQAEMEADEKDYANLGQINIRIADLYRRYYADKEVTFEKYRKALEYYKLTNDERQQQNCYFNMAGCLGITGRADPRGYFKKALELAIDLNDTSRMFQCQELLSRQLSLEDSTRDEAKQIAKYCLDNYPKFVNADLLLDLAFIFAKEGKNDSAVYYLSIVDNNIPSDHKGQIQARCNSIHALIHDNNKDFVLSESYSRQSRQVSDSITENSYRYNLQHMENMYNKKLHLAARQKTDTLRLIIVLLTVTLFMVLAGMAVLNYRKNFKIKSIIQELNYDHVNNHDVLMKQIDEKESLIGVFVNNMVTFMRNSIETSEKDPPTQIRRTVKHLIRDVTTDDFWNELRNHLDRNYDNIITKISKYPKITEKDLRFVELCCCGFSYIEIAVTLDYTPKYVSQKRKEIARKLRLKTTLQEYLENLIQAGNNA